MTGRVRLHVVVWQIIALFWIAVRSGISRCPDACNKPLGIADYRIRDDQMSASSAYDNDFATFGAHRARLNLKSWPPGYRANTETFVPFHWLKINMDHDTVITGIATQGYGNSSFNEWVTNYMVFYDKIGAEETVYCTEEDGETVKTFTGNFDSSSVQYQTLAIPVVTRSVTINPMLWNKNIGFRMELYGCKPEFYFVAMITVRNSRFTLDYANPKSKAYIALKQEILAEVTELLARVPGFLFADLRTLSPQSYMTRPIMAAEIKIYCTQSKRAAVGQELESSIKNGDFTILGVELSTENRFDCRCDFPNITLDLEKSLENATVIYSNGVFLLRASFQDNCNPPSGYNFFWEVCKCEIETGMCNQIMHYGKPGRTKKLYPRLFGAAYLYIRCLVKNGSSNILTYDYGYVRIILPPLVAKIAGPSEVIRGNVSVVIISASESYDPEKKHKKTEGLTLTWYCRKKENVLHDNQDEPSTVSPNDVGGCHGDDTGKINNSSPQLYLNMQNFRGNATYIFDVVVQKGDRSSNATHELRVEEPFVISIRCTTNCGSKVSVNRRLTLKSSCSGPLCDRIVKHNWLLLKRKFSGEKAWINVPNLKDKILTDMDSPNLVIPGDKQVLEENNEYKIREVVTLPNGFTFAEEIMFPTNSPPRITESRGGCSVTPSEGFVLTTEFNFSCSGWSDDELPLTYEFRYQANSGVLVINSGPRSHAIARLPLGNITLEVLVSDSLGASTVRGLEVQVKPIPPDDLSKVLETSDTGGDSQLKGLVNSGNVDEAAQMAYSILTAVDEASVNNDDKQAVKETILEQISTVEVNSMQQVTQLSAVVVMATEGEKDIAVTAQENAVGLLENMTDFITSQISAEGKNVDLVQDIGGNLLQGMSNSLSTSAQKATAYKEQTVEELKDEDNVDTERKQNKDIARKTLHLIDKLGSGLLAVKVPGEKPSVFYTDKLSVMLDRQTPAKMSGKTLGEGEQKVSLPSAKTLFGARASNLKSVDAQMTSFNENPFTWDASAKDIQSSVVDFSLKTDDGTNLKITGLKDPVELFIPVQRTGPKTGNKSDVQYFVKPSNGTSNLRYHRIDLPSANSIVSFEIQPEHEEFLEIFVTAQRKPTPTDYQFKTRVPDFSSCALYSKSTGYHNCSNNPYEISLSSNVTGKTGTHYIGIMFAPGNTEKARISRSCGSQGGRQKRSCIGVKDPPTTPPPTPKIVIPKYNRTTDVNYTMSVTVTSCLYWSEEKQVWTNEGCSIGPKTKSGSLHCLCTHLSAFGGDFFVAPNPIDFDKVWENFGKLADTGNFVVLATVCSIFGVYVIGLVFARRADRNDEMKVVGNVYLSDNVYTNGCVYNLHVQTGMWRNQGTTAQVGIVLYGEEGCSGPISLSDSNARKILFARGSVNSFTLALPNSLGRLFKILIWHDNSGESPTWFLQQVEVEDSSTGDKWHFIANRWLALEKGSGEIEFEINVADKKELAKFKNLFVFRTARSLGDGHLWLSVLTRPPHIAFTRCQRLSCCLSILFTAMVVNAMFYNFGSAPKDSFQVGPIKMSWTQIKIGIQSSFIAIPVNVLVVMIFRNIKQKSRENVFDIRADDTEEKEKVPGCLPHFFVYVGWIMCILTSLAAAAFIVFYSMMWGKEISNQWLTSITVSFVQDVFVSQPVKVILLASLLSLIIRKPPEREKVFGVTYQKEDRANKTVAGPPQGDELKKAKDFRAKVQGMYKVLAEISFFLIFVLLLMIVCYGNRSTTRYLLTNSMEDAYKNFKGKNISSFWTWMRSQLFPALYDTRWYNGWIFDHDEGFMGNRELFMVGMPRLRQIRIKPASTCQVTEKALQLGESFTRCVPSYSSKNEYKTPYNLPEWIPVTNMSHNQSVFELEKVCPKPWRYRSSWDLQTLSYEGFYSTYSGGGFVADLGYNIKSALNVVNKLQANNWIDEFSVAVFIEFTIFNPSSSLFSVTKCLYERSPTGGIMFSRSVRTLTLYKASRNNFQKFYEVCQLLFMVIILFFVIDEASKIYRKRKQYFKGFWNWVELLQILTAVSSVVIYFLKAKYASSFVKKVRNNPFETSSADYIVLWSMIEIYVLSLLIFIVTMKFLRLIRFNRHVCQMMGTLARAVRPLVSYFVIFVATVLAYTQLALLIFGSTMGPYSSFFNSLRAVLQMLLGGQMFFYEIKSVNGLLGPLFVFLYMFTMTFILLNMFLAILNESYFEVVESPENDFSNADLGHFMVVYLSRNIKLLGRRFVKSLKNSFQGKRFPRQSKNKDFETLFSNEIERRESVKKLCPIASMESLAEESDEEDVIKNPLENTEDSNDNAFLDSGNLTLSLLSIDEEYESEEDEYLERLLRNVRRVANSSEFFPGVPPMRPIVETMV